MRHVLCSVLVQRPVIMTVIFRQYNKRQLIQREISYSYSFLNFYVHSKSISNLIVHRKTISRHYSLEQIVLLHCSVQAFFFLVSMKMKISFFFCHLLTLLHCFSPVDCRKFDKHFCGYYFRVE